MRFCPWTSIVPTILPRKGAIEGVVALRPAETTPIGVPGAGAESETGGAVAGLATPDTLG